MKKTALSIFLSILIVQTQAQEEIFSSLTDGQQFSFWESGRQYHLLKKGDVVVSASLRRVKGIGRGIQLFLNIYSMNPDPLKSYYFDEANVSLKATVDSKKPTTNEIDGNSMLIKGYDRDNFQEFLSEKIAFETFFKSVLSIGIAAYGIDNSNSIGDLLITSAISSGARESAIKGRAVLSTLATVASYDYLGRTDVTNYRPANGFIFFPDDQLIKSGLAIENLISALAYLQVGEELFIIDLPINQDEEIINFRATPLR